MDFCGRDDSDNDSIDGQGLAEDHTAGGVQTINRLREKTEFSRDIIAVSLEEVPPGESHLIRFLDRMRGALMAAPSRELPVRKIPLRAKAGSVLLAVSSEWAHHAAPSTERPRAIAVPKKPKKIGLMLENWLPQSSP